MSCMDPRELLPCPFCGGVADFVDVQDEDGRGVAVSCDGCGVGSRIYYPLKDDATRPAGDAWNDRAGAAKEMAKLNSAALDLIETALAQTGCDGDLCAYGWHGDARRLLTEAGRTG